MAEPKVIEAGESDLAFRRWERPPLREVTHVRNRVSPRGGAVMRRRPA